MAQTTVVLPGQVLSSSSKSVPGLGTHLHSSQICSSLAGTVSPSFQITSSSPLPTTSVSRSPSVLTETALPSCTPSVLPAVDSTVLARVIRINPRQASVLIHSIDLHPCTGEGFPALIRVQDVRATEKDKVKIFESFRPGDVVRAVVISLGDQANYYLSTARNDLGVVIARSEAGAEMLPVSWKEFEAADGSRELRKVAKPG